MKRIISTFKEKWPNYLLESLVITAGILMAFGLNNWNEQRKEKTLQIEILKGIQANLTSDTVEINDAVKYYGRKMDSLLLDHLRHKRPYKEEVHGWFLWVTNFQFVDVYQTSAFDEAKQIGLHIIENDTLRAKLSRLYEYDYVVYRGKQAIDFLELMNPYLFEYNELGKERGLGKLKYDELLADEGFLMKLGLAVSYKREYYYQYLEAISNVNSLLVDLEAEIARLEGK